MFKCGACRLPVAVGVQCSVCDIWYHCSAKKPCVSEVDQIRVPFICSVCCDVLHLDSLEASPRSVEARLSLFNADDELSDEKEFLWGSLRSGSMVEEASGSWNMHKHPALQSPRSSVLSRLSSDIGALRRISSKMDLIQRRRSQLLDGVDEAEKGGTPNTPQEIEHPHGRLVRSKSKRRWIRVDPPSAEPSASTSKASTNHAGVKMPLSACEALETKDLELQFLQQSRKTRGLRSTEVYREEDVFGGTNLAERHNDIISSHRRLYHSHLPDFYVGATQEGGGDGLNGSRMRSDAIPARISIVEEVQV